MANKNMASERVRLNMTQEDMAKRLNIAVSTLCRYEKDADTIPPAILKKSADIFGCSTDYLLDLTPERVAR